MTVPLLDLKAQYADIKHRDRRRGAPRAWRARASSAAPRSPGSRRRSRATRSAPHAIACASGTDALLLALRALGVGPGDEVVTSAYSFFASAGTIVNAGATPVFVDIDPRTYNLDPHRLEAAITPRTKAVIAVHLYGQCCDLDARSRRCATSTRCG